MKILLVRPPETNRIWAGIPRFFNDDIFLFPPLGLMQLKAFIERQSQHSVVVYDALMRGGGYGDVAEFARSFGADVVGISTFTHSLADVMETARMIRRLMPSAHITSGGPHTYSFPVESKYLLAGGNIDSVVLGDGEASLVGLLRAVENGASFSGIKGVICSQNIPEGKSACELGLVEDMDSLPFPSRDIYRLKDYYTPASTGKTMTTMITSRGCPYSCKFCDVQRRYRSRSIGNIADEMEACVKLGMKEVFFIDDTFNVSAQRVVELSEEILRRGVKLLWGFKGRCDNVNRDMLKVARRSGCFRIHYGVETGTKDGLESIGKRVTPEQIKSAFLQTHEAGIISTAYFIIGIPEEKRGADILRTLDFASTLAADYAVFSLLSPYPDTKFYSDGVKKGIFDPYLWRDFMRHPSAGATIPTCWDESFSKQELLRWLKLAHRRFYYRPRIIFNAFRNCRSFTALKRMFSGGLSLLKLEGFRGGEGRI